MMHRLGCVLLSAVASTMLGGAARAESAAVIELFTSQGCSSCPAADKLLGAIAKDPSLVVISLPITYWDYLGWKDTLALATHTQRQRGYSVSRGDRQLYTPQLIINGQAQVLGNDKAAVESAIAKAKASSLPVPVIVRRENDKLTVTIKDGKPKDGVAEVWACAYAKAIPVAISKGENRGKTVTYTHVARRWEKLGEWRGGAGEWTLATSKLDGAEADQIAVLVQSGTVDKPGPILGAAVIASK